CSRRACGAPGQRSDRSPRAERHWTELRSSASRSRGRSTASRRLLQRRTSRQRRPCPVHAHACARRPRTSARAATPARDGPAWLGPHPEGSAPRRLPLRAGRTAAPRTPPAQGAANLCVGGDPFTLRSSVLEACSALSRRSLSIARVLSVSVAGCGGADSTTRGGVFERRGSAIAIFAPHRLHRTISRRPRTFSSAICSCALQLSQLNCI